MASSPVPRTKLLLTVMLLPTVPLSETLLILMPSAHVCVRRLFWIVPPVPEAQKPDSTCWCHMPSASQLVPVVSIAPPSPSFVPRLSAFESTWKFLTVQEVTENTAARPTLFG